MLFLRNFVGCSLSVALLIIAYPQIECWPLAWIALVPLLLVINTQSYGKAFFWGLFFGFLFFFGTLGWLIYVTYPGTILLSLYLAVYPAFFALGFVYFKKLPLISRAFVLSSLWTVLEFIRSSLFTGFGWVTLGHSQYKNILLIQISDIVGIYGISFLVVLVNLVVFETIRIFIKGFKEDIKDLKCIQGIVLILLSLVLVYGLWVLKTTSFTSTLKVTVVQPNITQKIKADDRYTPVVVTKTLELTDKASRLKPDMIVWPEEALPGLFGDQPAFVEQIQLKAMDLKTPLMIGVVLQEKEHYYNSAMLIAKDGAIEKRYDKIHLVPFGEFLPLRPYLGWLNKYIGLEDFTSGHEYTLFPIGASHKFGVLICFEDTLSDLWRNFTKTGAEFMVNMTNDSWFEDTKEPFVHLQGAVLQCVQNKRSLVRAADTGVSGFIDPLGRIITLAKDKTGKNTFVTAIASADVPLNHVLTFYTKYADIFTYLCFVCILWGVWVLRNNDRRKNV